MAKLIYPAIASLDGYVSDENGNFDWGFSRPSFRTSRTSGGRPTRSCTRGRWKRCCLTVSR
jgi:hypothetical protein